MHQCICSDIYLNRVWHVLITTEIQPPGSCHDPCSYPDRHKQGDIVVWCSSYSRLTGLRIWKKKVVCLPVGQVRMTVMVLVRATPKVVHSQAHIQTTKINPNRRCAFLPSTTVSPNRFRLPISGRLSGALPPPPNTCSA